MAAVRLPVAMLVAAFGASAQDAAKIYRETVRPLLASQCSGCHQAAQKMSGLDVSARDGLLKGGKRGPALIPGDAESSLMFQAVAGRKGLAMPPGKPLPAATVEAVRAWIDGGAPFSELESPAKWGSYKEEDLWAFRPLKSSSKGSVDAFINATLAKNGIKAAARADRRTLIRRVTLDLTGLPPTPEDVDRFVADRSPDAYERLVDRLLASQQYGERWARHWLDVVRYADTNGYSNDFERPNAWRYRDYVIRSFQKDKPYDRFILEQIAGDELFGDDPEALIATGFLRAGPWEHTAMSVAAETRQMFLDDVTHATATVFLGLTLGCARCHDHKFDPIPARDYYRMQAVFATTAFARRPVEFLAGERRDGFDEGRQQMEATMAQLKARIAPFRESNAEQEEQVKLYRKHLSMYQLSAERYLPKAFSVSSGLLFNDVSPGGDRSYLQKEDYEKAETYVLTGGNIASRAERVTPGVLSAVERYSGSPGPEIPESMSGRRAALAKWIASPRNPLTARVMVNRIWQGHFGHGIAGNTNNFGKMGKKPSHPELLDWLAGYFIQHNWSVKAVHRVILLSETYQRAGRVDAKPELLAAFPPRRLEAEVLRDSILAVSGELSSSAGGPGTYPQINVDAAMQARHAMGTVMPAYYASPRKQDRNRRSIYCFQQRSLVDPAIEVFNGASMDMSCERRESTTVPTQAFALFNSQFAYDAALALAIRVSNETNPIEQMFRLAFGRLPRKQESERASAHVAEMTRYHGDHPLPAAQPQPALVRSITSELTGQVFRYEELPPPWKYEPNADPRDHTTKTRALADLALALFNSNEFAFLE